MNMMKQETHTEAMHETEGGVVPPAQNGNDEAPPNRTEVLKAWRRTLAASRLLQVLGVALLLQLLLAGGLYWNTRMDSDFVVAEQLLAFDDSQADTLEIVSEDESVSLTRQEGGWQIAGDLKLPADTAKVDQLLSQLGNLEAGLPVASSKGAREQLDVADDDFQRHVRVLQGDQVLADLYVGTSPGYQRAHVRRAGEDAIVAASLNVHDMPEDVNGWMDRELLAFDDVSGIQTDDFTLSSVDDDWQIEAPEERVTGHTIAQESLDRILQALHGLRVNEIVMESDEILAEPNALEQSASDEQSVSTEDDTAREDSDEPAQLVWEVTENGSEPVTLTLTRHESEVTVERSDRPWQFKAPLSLFTTLNEIDLDTLLPATPTDDDESAENEGDVGDAASSATAGGSAGLGAQPDADG